MVSESFVLVRDEYGWNREDCSVRPYWHIEACVVLDLEEFPDPSWLDQINPYRPMQKVYLPNQLYIRARTNKPLPTYAKSVFGTATKKNNTISWTDDYDELTA